MSREVCVEHLEAPKRVPLVTILDYLVGALPMHLSTGTDLAKVRGQ